MPLINSPKPTSNEACSGIPPVTGLDVEDRQENDRSLQTGMRLLSSYRSTAGATYWIITEADRSATTLLMPDDY